MTKQEIIKTAVYFADRWKVEGRKVIYGDLPDRYEKAERLASEMLRWRDHKAWEFIQANFKFLLKTS